MLFSFSFIIVASIYFISVLVLKIWIQTLNNINRGENPQLTRKSTEQTTSPGRERLTVGINNTRVTHIVGDIVAITGKNLKINFLGAEVIEMKAIIHKLTTFIKEGILNMRSTRRESMGLTVIIRSKVENVWIIYLCRYDRGYRN